MPQYISLGPKPKTSGNGLIHKDGNEERKKSMGQVAGGIFDALTQDGVCTKNPVQVATYSDQRGMQREDTTPGGQFFGRLGGGVKKPQVYTKVEGMKKPKEKGGVIIP